jgi:1-acyl-sn-glycerol-3-phosphate acyltransferase
MLRTIIVVVYLTAAIFLLLPFLILYTAIVRTADPMYFTAMKALRLALRMAGIRVRVEGAENIPARTCVFVSNHVSNVDPPALAPYIPRRVAILAKKEVFRIPILSIALRQTRILPIDRGNKDETSAAVDQAIEYLREGTSFLVFAEGTRSRDGHLKPFKNGTFIMAIEAGAMVVPISLIGTQNLMRKGEWFMRKGEMTVRFGPAVDASEYKIDHREALRKRVFALVAAGLPEDQRPLEREHQE